MQFTKRFWAGLQDGTITVAVRRWRRPSVKAGGTMLSNGGLLAIDSVEVIEEGEVTEEDAVSAGYADRAELM
ncbi:MAG TPA: hypothetical protein VIV08_03845, partial [Acidimicrobiia bacterium]